MLKKIARLRRAKSTRSHIRELGVPRLSVLRTGQHLYAQIFTPDGSKVLASASTVQSDVRDGLKNGKNADAATKVGQSIAEKAKAAPVKVASLTPVPEKAEPASTGSVAPAAPAAEPDQSFRWPAKGRVISGYGTSGNEGINIAVPEGYSDAEAAFVREAAILPLIRHWQPQAILVQAGADALAEDPLARLALSNNAYFATLRAVMGLAPRLIVTGGGGYNPWSVARC